MSQEDPLGLAHPPDGALVVVEGELDEGVVLVEVDLVQPELHFRVIRVLRRVLRPALFRGDVVPSGGGSSSPPWDLFGTPAALESHLLGVWVNFSPLFGRLGGDDPDPDAGVDALHLGPAASQPRPDVEEPLEAHIDNLRG